MTEEAKLAADTLRKMANFKQFLAFPQDTGRIINKCADLIESLSKQLDDQTVVIDRIYEQCKTLQNDLKELGFDSIADMYVQLEQTENKLSELLSHATGGRFSKPDYSIDDMRRFVDDYNQSTCNECDQLEYVMNERDAAIRDFTEVMKYSENCMFCKYLSGTDDEIDCNKPKIMPCENCWQWRGVEVTDNAQKGSDAKS